MKLDEIAGKHKVHIFCDLDGTIVDFDKSVKELTGHLPSELKKKDMWNAVYSKKDNNGVPNFFRSLDWLPDGKQLWNFIKPYHPTILTGLPTGGNGKEQKEQWCAEHLGSDVPVIVCPSRDKRLYAKPGFILIDDRNDTVEAWIDAGGIGILHRSAARSIEQIKQYL